VIRLLYWHPKDFNIDGYYSSYVKVSEPERLKSMNELDDCGRGGSRMELANLFAVLVTYFIGGTGTIAAYSQQGNGISVPNPNYLLLSASMGFILLGTLIILKCLAKDAKSAHLPCR
jgi:hypothetical protein